MIQEKAYAKLDLNIHILPEKKDDLFRVKYLDCQIDLYDDLLIQKNPINKVICNNHPGLNNENNFAFKVIEYFERFLAANDKTKITIEKNIPIKAGFGGGSSDAAAALKGLQKLWSFRLQKEAVIELSHTLGKDFFYSYHGGLCEINSHGKDYQIKKIAAVMPEFWLVIVMPEEKKPSTGWMYQKLDQLKIGNNLLKLTRLRRAIEEQNKDEILLNLFNDFEGLAIKAFPVVADLKRRLLDEGAGASLMAGAGLSVVGFFNSKPEAEKVFSKLKKEYRNIYLTRII